MSNRILSGLWLDSLAEPDRSAPADWCVSHLRFDEAGNHGPFTVDNCEYIVEPLNTFADKSVNDVVLCWGSQTRKTGTLMGGMCWALVNDPAGAIWVTPTRDLAAKFSRQRWRKMLAASPGVSGIVSARRVEHTTLNQIFLNGAALNFVGSNSAANLAMMPCRRVVMDEVDKFPCELRAESDAVALAEQRTKNSPDPQRWKTSTPTVFENLIWQEMLRGDFRRWNVPCPHCAGLIVLAWSPGYSCIPACGNEAHVYWEKTAKRDDGTWCLDTVRQTAHAQCPHCGGKILDEHKPRMNRGGRWVATRAAPGNFRSYHLPSLYSCAPECGFGKLAVKFLEQTHSLHGAQSFINGDLAEPRSAQHQAAQQRAAVIEVDAASPGVDVMTVDCQARAPFFWYVVRRWRDADASSVALACGSVDTWDELDAVQKAHGVQDAAVMVDSGYGARADADVYRACAARGELTERAGARPLLVGWMPGKGIGGRRSWTTRDSNGSMVKAPHRTVEIDPFIGTEHGGKCAIELFEFSTDSAKDLLEMLRVSSVFRWGAVEAVANDPEYCKHMNSEHKMRVWKNGRSQWKWELRSHHSANHLFDCEVMQVAMAGKLGLLEIKCD